MRAMVLGLLALAGCAGDKSSDSDTDGSTNDTDTGPNAGTTGSGYGVTGAWTGSCAAATGSGSFSGSGLDLALDLAQDGHAVTGQLVVTETYTGTTTDYVGQPLPAYGEIAGDQLHLSFEWPTVYTGYTGVDYPLVFDATFADDHLSGVLTIHPNGTSGYGATTFPGCELDR